MEKNKTGWEEMDRIFGAAKEDGGDDPRDDQEVPPGVYNVKIERAEWKEAKTSGQKYLSFGLVILSGPQKNRWIWKSSFLSNVQSAKFLIKDLAAIGVKLERISLLNLETLLDIELEVKVTVKPSAKDPSKEFRNVDFLKQLTIDSSDDSDDEAPF